MAIVNEYNNTTAIYHGGVSYSSVYKNLVQYFPDPWTPPVPSIEYIELTIEGNSGGNILIPINPPSTTNYDWNISIDGGAETRYTGTSQSGGVITISGYDSREHNVKITPYGTANYGWAKAFCYNNQSSSRGFLRAVIYDGSYMGYAVSATDTGDYFRAYQYYGCDNLTIAPNEYIPSTVTTIGNYFRYRQYYNCYYLATTGVESTPQTAISIGDYFRAYQYYACRNLTSAAIEVMPEGNYTIGDYFRSYQYYNAYGITTAPNEALSSTTIVVGNNFRQMQYDGCSSLLSAPAEVLPSTITSIGTYFRRQQYRQCTDLSEVKGIKDLSIGNSNYRTSQFAGCNTNKTVKVLSDVGYNWNEPNYDSSFKNAYITQVSVPSAYLQNFIDATTNPWQNITDSKFIGY